MKLRISGVTESTDFPATPSAFQQRRRGSIDAFITKLSRDGSRGVMAYGETREAAISNTERLPIEVIADRIKHGEISPPRQGTAERVPRLPFRYSYRHSSKNVGKDAGVAT